MTKTVIALVPCKVGQEPEGTVSSLDPDGITDRGFFRDPDPASVRAALAAAVREAKRDPWTEWKASLRLPWAIGGPDEDGDVYVSVEGGNGYMSQAGAKLAVGAHVLAEEARDAVASLRRACLYSAADALEAALRKTGAPVDEPESAEDVDDDHHVLIVPRTNRVFAEDVPELWVSRDYAANPGTIANLWVKGKPIQNPTTGRWWPVGESDGSEVPQRLADALALKPGDCRPVTRDEYELFFKPVLKLDPSERYAALERMAA